MHVVCGSTTSADRATYMTSTQPGVRKKTFGEHHGKVWTPPTSFAPRLLWCPRLHTSMPCYHGFGSIRLDDVGHAATGCTAVTVVVGSPQQHVMASFMGGSVALLQQHHRRGSCGDARPSRRAAGAASTSARVRVTGPGFSVSPGAFKSTDGELYCITCGYP